MNASTSLPVAAGAPVEAPGERFEFGRNWAAFLKVVNDQRIGAAEESLKQTLPCDDLAGRSFLDIGSGSGLFSLAARRLGARVHSFDYDEQSVACTRELRRRFFPGDPQWQVERGSALDRPYIESLGRFDVVYSWGVLHHTGDMWTALDLARIPLAPAGRLVVAIYNDTGSQTVRWTRIKRTYGRLPGFLKTPFAIAVCAPGEMKSFARSLAGGRPAQYLRSWKASERRRGMSRWYDIIDWVGGYPYQAARADQVFRFYRDRGLSLTGLVIGGGLGCNEFVFASSEGAAAAPSSEPATPARTRPR
jgi:SAM-dependent methyltransferase